MQPSWRASLLALIEPDLDQAISEFVWSHYSKMKQDGALGRQPLCIPVPAAESRHGIHDARLSCVEELQDMDVG